MSTFSGPVQIFDGDQRAASSSTQAYPVGTQGITDDGLKYRYILAGGTTLAAGKLAVAATVVANHINMAVAAAAAVGDTAVTVTLGATAATANQYANGYLLINDANGEGIQYQISSNPAADASASLVLTLKDPVKVALTTSSQATLLKNPWDSVVISATDQADMPVGVPNVSITNAEYGWVQTSGPCAILADEAITAGAAITIGSSVAGAVEALDAAGEPQVGVAMVAFVNTEYQTANLTID